MDARAQVPRGIDLFKLHVRTMPTETPWRITRLGSTAITCRFGNVQEAEEPAVHIGQR